MVRDRGSAVVSRGRPAGFGSGPGAERGRRGASRGPVRGVSTAGSPGCRVEDRGWRPEERRGTERGWTREQPGDRAAERSEAGARLGSAPGAAWAGVSVGPGGRVSRLHPACRAQFPGEESSRLRGTRATEADGRARSSRGRAAPGRGDSPAPGHGVRRAEGGGRRSGRFGNQGPANARPARRRGGRASWLRSPPREPPGRLPEKEARGCVRERRPLGPGSGRATAGPPAARREPRHAGSLGSSCTARPPAGGRGWQVRKDRLPHAFSIRPGPTGRCEAPDAPRTR